MKKDVIYIDVEDDITGIIDKIKASKSHIVALVPPKRSSVMQSAVNMKLLRRTASDKKKQLVLITNEKALLGLAGGVGLYVAKNLQSKPEIPEAPQDIDEEPEVIKGDEVPVGELDDAAKPKAAAAAGAAGGAAAAKSKNKADKKAAKAAAKSDKKKRIPNFNSFRAKLFLGIGIFFGLILLWFFMYKVLPSATITIKAQTSKVNTDIPIAVNTALSQSDIPKAELKAEREEIQRTVTESFPATGQKNVGQQATGQMTIKNCESSNSITVPAGTTFTSSSGLTFTSDESVNVPGGSVFFGSCSPGQASVGVTATQPGDQYNLASGTSYGVGGFSSSLTATGGQMSGGTTQNVKVVTQADIDAATNKVLSADSAATKNELKEEFSDEYIIIDESFTVTPGQISSSPGVDGQADTAQLNAQFTYSILGVKKDELNQVLENYQKTQIDESRQEVYNTGIEQISFTVSQKISDSDMRLQAKTTGYVGPQLNTEQLAEEVSGKRYSETIDIVKSRPGVLEVKVDYSPFWVKKSPKPSRITFVMDVSDQTNQ